MSNPNLIHSLDAKTVNALVPYEIDRNNPGPVWTDEDLAELGLTWNEFNDMVKRGFINPNPSGQSIKDLPDEIPF